MDLGLAGRKAMEDLNALGGRFLSAMSFVALDREGRHVGFSNVEGRTYIYQTGEMSEPAEMSRIHIETKKRWRDGCARPSVHGEK